jgi:hypothetical protein
MLVLDDFNLLEAKIIIFAKNKAFFTQNTEGGNF